MKKLKFALTYKRFLLVFGVILGLCAIFSFLPKADNQSQLPSESKTSLDAKKNVSLNSNLEQKTSNENQTKNTYKNAVSDRILKSSQKNTDLDLKRVTALKDVPNQVYQQIEYDHHNSDTMSVDEILSYPITATVIFDTKAAVDIVGKGDGTKEKLLAIKQATDKVIASQNDLIGNINEVDNTVVNNQYGYLINAANITTSASHLKELSQVKGVKSVQVDDIFKPTDQDANEVSNVAPVWDGSWDIDAELQNGLSHKYHGEGMTVAVLDTGVDVRHRDFRLTTDGLAEAKFSSEYINDAIDVLTHRGAYYSPKIPFVMNYADKTSDINLVRDNGQDEGEHGQHVSGIIAANTPCLKGVDTYTDSDGNEMPCGREGVVGVAPEAQIIAMKLSKNGEEGLLMRTIISASEDCVALGVDAVNMSFGITSDALTLNALQLTLISKMASQGIVPVVAAGNSASATAQMTNVVEKNKNAWDSTLGATIGSPGFSPDAITVGSTDNSQSFSKMRDLAIDSSDSDSEDEILFTPNENGAVITNDSYPQGLQAGTNDGFKVKGQTISISSLSGKKLLFIDDDNRTQTNEYSNIFNYICSNQKQNIKPFPDNIKTYLERKYTIPSTSDESYYETYNDKILMIERRCNSSTYSDMSQKAYELGFAGAIFVNINSHEYVSDSVAWYEENPFPQMLIGKEASQKLLDYFGVGTASPYTGTRLVKSCYDSYSTTYNCLVSRPIHIGSSYLYKYIVDNANRISYYSSFGPAGDLNFKPDVSAPGGNVNSTVNVESGDGGYAVFSGTSMASPFTAGSILLLKQKMINQNSQLPQGKDLVNLFRSQLQSSAVPVGLDSDEMQLGRAQGAGRIQVAQSLDSPLVIQNELQTNGNISLGAISKDEQTVSASIYLKNISDQMQKYQFDSNNSFLYQESCEASRYAVPNVYKNSLNQLFYTEKDQSTTYNTACSLYSHIISHSAFTLKNAGIVVGNGEDEAQNIEIPAHSSLQLSLTINLADIDFSSDTFKMHNGGFIGGNVAFKPIDYSLGHPNVHTSFLGYYGNYNQDETILDAPAYCIDEQTANRRNDDNFDLNYSVEDIAEFCHPKDVLNPEDPKNKGIYYTRFASGGLILDGTSIVGTTKNYQEFVVMNKPARISVNGSAVASSEDQGHASSVQILLNLNKPAKKINFKVVKSDKQTVMEDLGTLFDVPSQVNSSNGLRPYNALVPNEFVLQKYDEKSGKFLKIPDGQYYIQATALGYAKGISAPEIWQYPLKIDSTAPVMQNANLTDLWQLNYDGSSEEFTGRFSADFVDNKVNGVCSGFYQNLKDLKMSVSLLKHSVPSLNDATADDIVATSVVDFSNLTSTEHISFAQNADSTRDSCGISLRDIKIPNDISQNFHQGTNNLVFAIADYAHNFELKGYDVDLNVPKIGGDIFSKNLYSFPDYTNDLEGEQMISSKALYIKRDGDSYELRFVDQSSLDIQIKQCSSALLNDCSEVWNSNQNVPNTVSTLNVIPNQLTFYQINQLIDGVWQTVRVARFYLYISYDQTQKLQFDYNDFITNGLGLDEDDVRIGDTEVYIKNSNKLQNNIRQNRYATVRAYGSANNDDAYILASATKTNTETNTTQYLYSDDSSACQSFEDCDSPYYERNKPSLNFHTLNSLKVTQNIPFDQCIEKPVIYFSHYSSGTNTCTYMTNLTSQQDSLDEFEEYYYNESDGKYSDSLTSYQNGWNKQNHAKCVQDYNSVGEVKRFPDDCRADNTINTNDNNGNKKREFTRVIDLQKLFANGAQTVKFDVLGVHNNHLLNDGSSANYKESQKWNTTLALAGEEDGIKWYNLGGVLNLDTQNSSHYISFDQGLVNTNCNQISEGGKCSQYNFETHEYTITGAYDADTVDEILFYGYSDKNSDARNYATLDSTTGRFVWVANFEPFSYNEVSYSIVLKNPLPEDQRIKTIGNFVVDLVYGDSQVNFLDNMQCSLKTKDDSGEDYPEDFLQREHDYVCDLEIDDSTHNVDFNVEEIGSYYLFVNDILAFIDYRMSYRGETLHTNKPDNQSYCGQTQIENGNSMQDGLSNGLLTMREGSEYCNAKFRHQITNMQPDERRTVLLALVSEQSLATVGYFINIHRKNVLPPAKCPVPGKTHLNKDDANCKADPVKCNANQVLQNGKCVNKPAKPAVPAKPKPVAPSKPKPVVPAKPAPSKPAPANTNSSATTSASAKVNVAKVVIADIKTNALSVGKKLQLNTSVLPLNATVKGVVYVSSDTKKATVSASGKVSAKKSGKVTITVKSKSNQNIKAKVTLYLIDKKVLKKTQIAKQIKIKKIKVGKKSLTITWSKQKGKYQVDKFTVQYRVLGKAKWQSKTVKSSSAKVVLKKLKAKLKYQIRVVSIKKLKAGTKSYKTTTYGITKTSPKVK